MENREAARSIFAVASLLESQGANPYRVRAYRRAAVNLLRLPVAASALVKEPEPPVQPEDPPPSGAPAKRKPKPAPGPELAVPWLGDRLRLKLAELVTTGQMQFHQDFLKELPKPLRELLAVPGIGPKTAQRLMDELGVRSPRGVVGQARKGRIQRLRGFGPVREAQLAAAAQQVLMGTPPATAVATTAAPDAMPDTVQSVPTALPQPAPAQLPLPLVA